MPLMRNQVSDTVYGSGWNGITTIAPSKNAVYDKIETVSTITTDGWVPAGETWTYASASTITVASGAASRYQKGDKIKWTQSTVKYGVIVTVADTLLTIAVNTDYTVADAAISDNYISRIEGPFGYPAYFNCTLSVTAGAGTPTNVTNTCKYTIKHNELTLYGSMSIIDKGTASGQVRTAPPVQPVFDTVGPCYEQNAVGHEGYIAVYSGVGYCVLARYDYASFWTSGYILSYTVTYLY